MLGLRLLQCFMSCTCTLGPHESWNMQQATVGIDAQTRSVSLVVEADRAVRRRGGAPGRGARPAAAYVTPCAWSRGNLQP